MKSKEQEEKWLKQRLSIVGASEISTVIKSECTEEEIKEAMGGSADEFMKDKPFNSPFCLYNYKKQTAKPPFFSPILSEYGHEMEKLGVKTINFKHCNFLNAENQPQELIHCKDLHKLAGYTPDAFIEFKYNFEFNKNTFIQRFNKSLEVKTGEKAVNEIKTTNLFKFKSDNWGVDEENEEVMFKYIIQNQYQVWIQNKIDPSYKYGIITCIIPYHKEFDNDFYKGRAVELCQNLTQENFEKLCGWFQVKAWIYPIYTKLHKIFEIALDRWEERLQNCSEPKSNYEYSEDSKINKKRLALYKNDFLVECQKKFGIENKGIIDMTPELQQKYPNLSDKLKIDKSNREDMLSSKKAIELTKDEFMEICLKEKIFGFNFEDFTAHLTISKKGSVSFRNNFKTLQETFKGKSKVKEYEMTPEDFMQS